MLQLRNKMRDPRWSLPRFGMVLDQKTGKELQYDPYAITHETQATILSYYGDTPRLTNPDGSPGQTNWFVLLGSRQMGKSLVPELAALPVVAFNPGYDHIAIADTKDRAQYLHDRVHFAYDRWPKEFIPKQKVSTQRRGLDFPTTVGGRMRVLSAEMANVGIGQSPDSFHGSEIPFWDNAGKRFNLIFPSMVNRDHCLVCLESTPAPGDALSVGYWKDLCSDARAGRGRWIYKFSPYWDGKLNVRPWTYGALDNDEIKRLNKYGHLGLSKENLAFRRFMIDTDREIRRNPDLFDVFYPSDDVTCWMAAASGVVPRNVWDRHQDDLVAWPKGRMYMEYSPPNPDALYVIGCDPAGYGARDHASFHVLEVWADEWKQVAVFSAPTDPNTYVEKIDEVGRRYNNAMVIVERNGVGTASTALLQQKRYPNLYHSHPGKPGVHVGSANHEGLLGDLIDALMRELTLSDAETVNQGMTYRNDKRVERNPTSELLTGGIGKHRRERHHWDRVSALIMAVHGARKMPRRYKPEPVPENVVPFGEMTYNDIQKYRDLAAQSLEPRGRRTTYRSVRWKR